MLGTSYGLVNYYGSACAEHVIIAMGSICDTIREYLMCEDKYTDNHSALKYGLISVHLYRPFPSKQLIKALPKTVRQISVLSRCKEPGSPGEPLYLDVLSALKDSHFSDIPVYSGRYGLGSKDTTPAQIKAVYLNKSKKIFTIGIDDDVTNLSLCAADETDKGSFMPSDTVNCLFWGLGGDGMVSASKNIIKIIGDNTDLKVQGYFEYDSKKSGGLTISHLRFSKQPILSSYLIDKADILVCAEPGYINKYNLADRIKEGGILLLNLPDSGDLYCSDERFNIDVGALGSLSLKKIRLFAIDAFKIGKETGLNRKVSTIIQAAFFAVSNIMPPDEAKKHMIEYSDKAYKKAGEKVLSMNREAIRQGLCSVKEVNIDDISMGSSGNAAPDASVSHVQDSSDCPDKRFVEDIMKPILKKQGDKLPVSAFVPYAAGNCVPGTSAYEKRNIADKVPKWIPENCIQCNRCSLVCPHAVIRPFLLSKEELDNAPKAVPSIPVMGLNGESFSKYGFSIGISCHDCTGCGSCVGVCPGKGDGKKALDLVSVEKISDEIFDVQEHFDYCENLPADEIKKEALQAFSRLGVKSSQFRKPLMEFSGACSGCGETPYVKLLTQLFGANLCISNATGCSSIWSNSYPSCVYCEDESGKAPSWSNSLFEDAAEFGYGMKLAHEINKDNQTVQWVIGGDGWAYDIGFSGVDHVLSSDKDINLLVLDTECYSNTGGQASKATPLGSAAKFAAGGKRTVKKDLAAIAMTYKNAYVASVALGADMEQTIKAFREAAAYQGPSIIIAYATCIAHGLTSGMGSSMHEEKKAVDAGYVNLFRYNPSLISEGENPLSIDSKPPKIEYKEFLEGENRYKITAHDHPEDAKRLFARAGEDALNRYNKLIKMREMLEP
jgi:pyruvate-ferredoxin/flavodoxin oxidoreductase